MWTVWTAVIAAPGKRDEFESPYVDSYKTVGNGWWREWRCCTQLKLGVNESRPWMNFVGGRRFALPFAKWRMNRET